MYGLVSFFVALGEVHWCRLSFHGKNLQPVVESGTVVFAVLFHSEIRCDSSTYSKQRMNKISPSRWQTSSNQLCCLETQNARWRHAKCRLHVLMKEFNDAEEPGWTSDRGKNHKRPSLLTTYKTSVRSMKATKLVAFVLCISPAAFGGRTPYQCLTRWLRNHIATLGRHSPPTPGASSALLGRTTSLRR